MPRLYSLVVKPSGTTPFVPPAGGEGWHVTHAALAEGQSLNNYASLSFKSSDDAWISLGTLQSTGHDFMSLDLPLTEYTEFKATGTGDIHLTGTLAAMEDDDDEAEMDFDFDEEEDEAEAEQEILNAMMNGRGGGGRKTKLHKLMEEISEEGEDETSEEEPELQGIEEVEAPKLHGEKTKGKTSSETAAAESGVVTGMSKSAKRKLKKKQRKEAKQATAMVDVSDRQPKQLKVETPPPEKPSAEKPAEEKGKAGESAAKPDSRKKRLRRFSNGFVIENLSYGNEEGPVVKPGKKVTIKYKGWLEDGKIFDENQGAGFTFYYGQGEVVKGLDKGLDDMRVGDKRKLTVPAKMGYGSQGAEPAVPPDADLTFEIEMIHIE